MFKKTAQGFTLIELLVVIAIIGILTATALPQYSDYKKRAFDSVAKSDLVHIAIAEEAYFLDSESYLSCSDASCVALPGIASLSQGVTVTMTASSISFTGSSQHSKGSGKTFKWDSEAGGLTN